MGLMKGDWKTARTILCDILPKLQDAPGTQKVAYVYLGQCYHQENNSEQEIFAYSAALKIDPLFTSARAGLAEVYLSRGGLPAAAAQWQVIVNGPHPDPEAALSLARIWIMMRLREDKEKRDWDSVDNLLDQIQKRTLLTPAIAVLKAEVLLAKDRHAEAQELLKQCAAKFPRNAQIWLALINLSMYEADQASDPGEKEQKWKQASDDIDQARQNLGDHPIVRERRGSCAVRRKDPQVVAVLTKLGQNVDKMRDLEKTHLWASLAALSVQADDLDLARSYCRLVAAKEPTNIRIRYLLCDLALHAYEKGQKPDLRRTRPSVE